MKILQPPHTFATVAQRLASGLEDGTIDLNTSTPNVPIEMPRIAVELLTYMLPPMDRADMIGDMSEEYTYMHTNFGRKRANGWVYTQIIRSVLPLLAARLGAMASALIALLHSLLSSLSR